MAASKFDGHPFCTLPEEAALKTEDHNSFGGGARSWTPFRANETFSNLSPRCTYAHKIFWHVILGGSCAILIVGHYTLFHKNLNYELLYNNSCIICLFFNRDCMQK